MREVTVKEWTDALRSGKYTQTKGALRMPDGFCCLGVLCDLADPKGWHEHIWNSDEDEDGNVIHTASWNWHHCFSDSTEELPLPKELMPLRFEVFPKGHSKFGTDIADLLASMNDAGNDFKIIATKIEELHEQARAKVEESTSGLAYPEESL